MLNSQINFRKILLCATLSLQRSITARFGCADIQSVVAWSVIYGLALSSATISGLIGPLTKEFYKFCPGAARKYVASNVKSVGRYIWLEFYIDSTRKRDVACAHPERQCFGKRPIKRVTASGNSADVHRIYYVVCV